MSWIIGLLFLAPFTGGLIALVSGYKNEKILTNILYDQLEYAKKKIYQKLT